MNKNKKYLETHRHKILQLQYHLQKHQYFSKSSLPGVADSLIFQIFDKECDQSQENNNFHPSITGLLILNSLIKKVLKNFDQFSKKILNEFLLFKSKCQCEVGGCGVGGNSGCVLPLSLRNLEYENIHENVNNKITENDKKSIKYEYMINITFKLTPMSQILKLLQTIQKKTKISIKLLNEPQHSNTHLHPSPQEQGESKHQNQTSPCSTSIQPHSLNLNKNIKIKLEIKCTSSQIQGMKVILDDCKNVENYELRKQKGKSRTSAFFQL